MASQSSPSSSPNGVTTAPNPEVRPKAARRRTFSAKQKLKVLEETDALPEGELGACLRRKGLYSSTLCRWRKQRDEGVLAAMAPKKRGACPNAPEARQLAELEHEVHQLREQLDRAEKVIDVQKKVCELFGAHRAGVPA